MKKSVNGVTLAYETTGEAGPWVIFSHSLGCSRQMWGSQIKTLAGSYRVLTYDLRGHGESGAGSAAGSLDSYADDVLALMDDLGIEQGHFVGISIGGMIGQTLAIQAPQRIRSLVLANTTCFMPPSARPAWLDRIQSAKSRGVAGVAGPTLERWFPESFRMQHSEVMAQLEKDFSRTSVAGYIACCEAIMNVDTRNELGDITCPTLIIAGTQDPGALPEVLQQMKDRIPDSELLMIDGAGHLSSIDHPASFNSAVQGFLARYAMN